jgi:hypothetical protein
MVKQNVVVQLFLRRHRKVPLSFHQHLAMSRELGIKMTVEFHLCEHHSVSTTLAKE